jgi:hypothetical protein
LKVAIGTYAKAISIFSKKPINIDLMLKGIPSSRSGRKLRS